MFRAMPIPRVSRILPAAALLLALLLSAPLSAGEAVFGNVRVHGSMSPLLAEREANRDPLLPPFDGDAEFKELLRREPGFWALGGVVDGAELVTELDVELVFVDGMREEQTCEILSEADTSEAALSKLDTVPKPWKLRMGLDFVSGASTTVMVHAQSCLEEASERLALVVRKEDGEIEVLPPKSLGEQIEEYRLNAELNGLSEMRVLKVSREVRRTASCPRDIEDYRLLLDVWREVSKTRTDIFQLEKELNRNRNGGRDVMSCAFSREHNRRYSDAWSLKCDVDAETCVVAQSRDGTKTWRYDDETDRFRYKGFRLFGLGFGAQSVRDGGKVLDLKLIPLSVNLYLEAYVDANGEPVALGLLTVQE